MLEGYVAGPGLEGACLLTVRPVFDGRGNDKHVALCSFVFFEESLKSDSFDPGVALGCLEFESFGENGVFAQCVENRFG